MFSLLQRQVLVDLGRVLRSAKGKATNRRIKVVKARQLNERTLLSLVRSAFTETINERGAYSAGDVLYDNGALNLLKLNLVISLNDGENTCDAPCR